MAGSIPYIEISGSNYEVGKQLGKYSKDMLPRFLNSETIRKDREEKLRQPEILKASLEIARQRYPQFIEEMQGIADGAGLTFETIFAFNWRPRPRQGQRGCTTLIVPKEDRVLIAHNEDWRTRTNDIFMARLRYKNGLDCLVVCYHGFLPGVSGSVNQAGVVQTLNALISSDGGPGLPMMFVHRAALEATSIEEAINIVIQPARADSENFNFAQGTRAVYAETSATDFEIVEVKTPTVHTNHFLEEKLKPFEASSRLESTHARYQRATKMLDTIDDPTPDDLKKILSSHEDTPWCICRHGSEADCQDYCDTLGSMVIDTKDRSIDYCQGPPCRGNFERFTL